MGSIDPEQLSGWFDAYGSALLLYARQWLDAESAEDLVQDVFVRLMPQRHVPKNIKAWLFQAVRNGAISHIRSRSGRDKHHRYLAAEREPALFETQAEDRIDAEVVQAALGSLSEAQREVVVLRIWAGMTLQEVANIVSEPVSTVFSQYKTALANLRKIMESPCETKHN